MLKRIILAAVISAVLVFAWGFVFWGLSGITTKLIQPLPEKADIVASLRKSRAPSGMYVYPMPVDPADEEANTDFRNKHREGPLLQLAYRVEGSEPMAPSMFAMGLGLNFVIALLTASLVALAGQGLPTLGRRVGFVLLFSVIVAIWSNGGDYIWWFHSPIYCAGNLCYQVVAGLLMGLVIGAIVRPIEA